jgi:hypothetical protein
MKTFLIISLLVLPVPFIVAARSEAPVAEPSSSHQTSAAKVLVDGAINPELISDYRVYSMLFDSFRTERAGSGMPLGLTSDRFSAIRLARTAPKHWPKWRNRQTA